MHKEGRLLWLYQVGDYPLRLSTKYTCTRLVRGTTSIPDILWVVASHTLPSQAQTNTQN